MFLLGRARLVANPFATGSVSRSIAMIGIVAVASLAALRAVELTATITSTGWPASSRAALLSFCSSRLVKRASHVKVCPATQPSSFIRCVKTDSVIDGVADEVSGNEVGVRKPTRHNFCASCAWASHGMRRPDASTTASQIRRRDTSVGWLAKSSRGRLIAGAGRVGRAPATRSPGPPAPEPTAGW